MNGKYFISDRIALLLERFSESYSRENVVKRRAIYAEAMTERMNSGGECRLAHAFAAFLNGKEIAVKEYDLLAGQAQYYDYTDSIPVTMPEAFDPAVYPRGLFDIPREIENFYRHTPNPTSAQRDTLEKMATAKRMNLFGRWNNGHLLCGYERMLAHGLSGLIALCEKSADAQESDEGKETVRAFGVVLGAMRDYVVRYARKAARMAANTQSEAYRQTLLRIQHSCERLCVQKPDSFFDAVQLVALTLDVIICENISGSISFGRMDQWLYPFYKKDLDAGAITMEEAGELIDALWIKIAGVIQGFQNVTLGGCHADGSFAGNDVTLLCLRASYKIRKDQPLLSLRYHPDMPEVFWEDIIDLIQTGLGFPALFNDEVVFGAKMSAGVDKKDVWRYGIVGCVEPCIEGLEYSNTEQLRVNWPMILGMMLDGKSYALQAHSPRALDAIDTFEEFYGWYKEELQYFTRLGMEACDLLDSTYGLEWPAPFISSLSADCLDKGRDLTRGAAKYSFSSVNGCGMADAVDSLIAVDELVFQQNLLTLEELGDAMHNNFRGYESLRSQAIQLKDRFGNDNDRSNRLMQDLTDLFIKTIVQTKNLYGNRFQVGLYTVDAHAVMGTTTGALPSGRLAGVSLANALSPCQGTDSEGPTAVICSIAQVDMKRLGNGMVLDLKFSPSFLEKKTHREKLKDMIEAYFHMGGLEIQFNVVGRETLLAAQEKPEDHRDLIVRVSGFSAYFVMLDKVLQNEIIARTEY